MKNKTFNFLLAVSVGLTSGSTFANVDWDSAEAAIGSGSWGDEITDTEDSSDVDGAVTTVQRDQTQSAPKPCTRDDQTSLPYKTLLKLFNKKKLSVHHSPSRQSLTLDGGSMIGNCNEMLSFDFAHPTGDLPYIFQVNFKRPEGCNDDKCEYNIYTADGGIANSETVKRNYTPNYDGFLQCLNDAGVIKDGKFNPDKIASVPFNKQYSDVPGGADLWFASHGPKPGKKGVYSKNKKPRMGCYFFEDIKKGGKTLYTKEQNDFNIKEDQFQAACKLKSYQAINDQLANFGNFKEMQATLKKIRDELLLNEVKDVHTLLQEKDLSEVDVDYVGRIIRDYNKIIIQPKRKKIAKLYESIRKMKNGSKKKKAIALLNKRVNELVTLAKPPYVNGDDYEAMIDFARKSPLHKEEWRSAAITLYTANTTVYHYERYRKGSKLPEARTAEVNRKINAGVREEKEDIEMRGNVAKDPNKSYHAEFSQEASTLENSKVQNIQELQNYAAQKQQHAMNYCMDPRKYWINRQRCVAEVQEDINYYANVVQSHNYGLDSRISVLNEKANYWGGLESLRWGANRPVQTQPTFPGQVPPGYNFTFDGADNRVPAVAHNPNGQQQLPWQTNGIATRPNHDRTQFGWHPNDTSRPMTPEIAAYFNQQQQLRQNPGFTSGFQYQYSAGVNNGNNAGFRVPPVRQVTPMPYSMQQTGPAGSYNF